MRTVLRVAGSYHILFALWAVCWPNLWFDWNGFERPNHPLLWQLIAVITGVLGVFLLLAARNPIANWMTVLVGLLKFTLAGRRIRLRDL